MFGGKELKELDDSYIWDCYNSLLLSADVDRIRKLLGRYELFKLSLDMPGDIVECGVFRGVGLMYWLKLLQIFAPGSRKKVIAFDTFASFEPTTLLPYERDNAQKYEGEAGLAGITMDEVRAVVKAAGFENRAELVPGDLQQMAREYVARNPGFRISLLHLDADAFAATKAALEAFWPVVVRGGVVVFDEYACRGWGESDAVDQFFAETQVRLQIVPHSSQPTAWCVKP